MPEQKPTSCIISRSYWVRIRSRWASSSLPLLEVGQPLLELGLDALDAPAHALLAGDVVRGREDDELVDLTDPSPVTGSTTIIRSISSPKSSMRTAVSSYAG